MERKKIIVIGAGASGMMAAYQAAKNGAHVILLEKNEKAGKKLYITGKGRCNITNACDIEELLDGIVSNYQFMYSGIYSFSNQDMIDFLEEHECPCKIERGKRVFPVSDHSSDVIRSLLMALNQQKVEICYHQEVKDILLEKLEEKFRCKGVLLKNGEKIAADAVIVATGGLSYSSTGSTGDGYLFAKKAGHTIKKTEPSLVPFNTKESFVKQLQGLALKNVKVSFYHKNKLFYEEQGEMLFTHFGISGPVVLSASAYMKTNMEAKDISVLIDFKPALNEKQLDERVLRDFEQMKNKHFKNALDKLLPKSLRSIIVEESGIDENKKINEVTKEERKKLLELLKKFPLHIASKRGYLEAIITKGGINVKEIDPSTMESKKAEGLYFAGEVLDLDAVTGGYNLQIAWSTGFLAGLSAAENVCK